MCSSPTPVITADFSPSRAVPQAMLVGEPPMYFEKRPHVLQPPADLVAVEIDRRAADGDEVQRLRHVSPASRSRLPTGLRPRSAPSAPRSHAPCSRGAPPPDRRGRAPRARTARSCTGPSKPRASSARICGTFSSRSRVVDQHPVRRRACRRRDVRIDDAGDVDDAGPLREELGLAGEVVVEGVVHQPVDVAAAGLVDRGDRLPLGAQRRDREAERLDEADEPALAQDRRHRRQRRHEIGVRRPACRR